MGQTDEAAFESARHVFVATVISSRLSSDGESVLYKLRTEETLKGNPKRAKGPTSPSNLSSWGETEAELCGVSALAVGYRVIVFAPDRGRVELGHCSPTRRIRSEDELERVRRIAGGAT